MLFIATGVRCLLSGHRLVLFTSLRAAESLQDGRRGIRAVRAGCPTLPGWLPPPVLQVERVSC
jgi:hypothetical protein